MSEESFFDYKFLFISEFTSAMGPSQWVPDDFLCGSNDSGGILRTHTHLMPTLRMTDRPPRHPLSHMPWRATGQISVRLFGKTSGTAQPRKRQKKTGLSEYESQKGRGHFSLKQRPEGLYNPHILPSL